MKPRLLDLTHGAQTVIDEADWPAYCEHIGEWLLAALAWKNAASTEHEERGVA